MMLRRASNQHWARPIVIIRTCFGKFTKSRNFRLHITALDFLVHTASAEIYMAIIYQKLDLEE